jgi:hypothetical protein
MRIDKFYFFPRPKALFWITISFFLFCCAPSYAAQVNLAWNASMCACDGYRVFIRTQGQDYDYDSPVWSGMATSCTLSELEENTYYFVTRAYRGSKESTSSNEIEFEIVINEAPQADTGPDQAVNADTLVDLDGSGSSDPDGVDTITAYQWTQTSGPSVSLSNPHSAHASFRAPDVTDTTTVAFNLVVTDDHGISDTDSCNITVHPNELPDMDSDNDGLWDEEEINIFGTDPYNADTDGDGVPDGLEVDNGTDPTIPDHNDENIWLEAEAGRLGAPMAIDGDGSASAGMAIGVPNGTGNFSSPDSLAGYAEYRFEIQTPGNYVVWGRVMAPSGKDDSFFAAMDSGAFVRWNTQRGSQWTWDEIRTSNQDPLLFNLEQGEHTLYIMQREDGTYLDKILITADMAFVPEGEGPVVNPPVTHFEVEAEEGILSEPFQIDEDAGASSGRFVLAPNGAGTFPSASASAGLAEYLFAISEEGDYVIWGRVLAPSGRDDSFHIAVDDSDFVRWNTLQSEQWSWDQANAHQGDDPLIYHLEAGSHRLYIMQREDGTCIDKLIVTKDLEFTPN